MDYNSNKTVPFIIPEINNGFQQAEGLLKVNKEQLELEFEVKDSILGVIKSGLKETVIPFSELKSIEFKKGWFSTKIILNGTSMKTFKDLPGSELASCTLKVKRKHRDEAETLISQARLQLSEYKLDQFDKNAG
ncbi:hypothetical protein G3570_15485 [Balneolaceae bacterium YR4-1]|uniref:Uncharacterized protein n=1 Tax=Halalkalibaculum roseum TaxID=2709311 RepID=A0A6M1SRK8_9BACT|nr:hypothetical protein [Halalkalibaculum roseum]NGP78051.1 hypothetical protein [Halalkalibaculum roseum]